MVEDARKVVNKRSGRTVYCHFSFKRPKGKDYGLFAVAFYSDFEGKNFIYSKTRRYELWENHQFITAIQSYEHALLTIYELQGQMMASNIKQVMLVTDNSILAGWIEDHNKNKVYKPYMDRAVKMYMSGAPKELMVGVGLCEVRKSEKSYKFCVESKVVNKDEYTHKDTNTGVVEIKNALDIINADLSVPEISNIKEYDVD